MNKRAKKELVASVVAQVLAAQKAKKMSRKARLPKGQAQRNEDHAHDAHGRLAKQRFTTSGKRPYSDATTAYDVDVDGEEPPPPAPKRVRITKESIPNNRLRNWTVAMRRNFKLNTIAEVMRPWELSRNRFDEVTPRVLVLTPNIVCITPRASATHRHTKHLRSTASALLSISLRNTLRLNPRGEELKLRGRLFFNARKSKLRTFR